MSNIILFLKKRTPIFIQEKYRAFEFNRNYKIITSSPNKECIIIVGCGRSGTTYTSKLFKSYGFDIGHERLGKNGISSWYLVSSQPNVIVGPNFKELSSLKIPIVHQVRHPLYAVSSFQAISHTSWKLIAKDIPINYEQDDKILRGMKYWYYWNLKAEKMAQFTYQVEQLGTTFTELLKIGNFPSPLLEASPVSKSTNTRPHSNLTIEDLKQTDKELLKKIISLGERYGYSF